MKIKLSFSCLIIFWIISPLAASTHNSKQLVQEAWSAWSENDQLLVEKKFIAAIELDPNNIRAYLGLSYLYNLQLKYDKAWSAYKKVIEIAEDPYPYIFAVWFTNKIRDSDNIMYPKGKDLLLKLSQDADDKGILKAMARHELGDFYKSKGELNKAKRYYDSVNSITEWMLIGPFENISASGFDKVFPPEVKYDASKTYEGKNGVPSKWFEIQAIRDNYWIDFRRYFAFLQSVFYANNFVYSPETQTVQIRIGTSGSLKAFLNDELIIENFEETNNDLDTYIVETELQKGWNKVLLKCGFSEIDQCNFMVRITDKRGEPIDGLQISTEAQSYKSKPRVSKTVIPNFAEAFFKQQIQQHPEHLENYLLLADCYLRNDKAIEAELILRDAIELSPQNAVFYHHLIEAYHRGEKADEAATTVEQIHKLDKNVPYVLHEKILKYFDNEELDKGVELFSHLQTLLPASEIVYELYLELFERKNQPEKVIETVTEAYERYPSNWTFAYLQAYVSIQITGQYDEAIDIIKKYLKDRYTITGLTTLGNFYLKVGKSKEWEDVCQKILKLDPAASGIYYQIADNYFVMQDYDKAEAAILQANKICPNSSSFWSKLGEIYRIKNKIDLSRQAYRTALNFRPTRYDVREKLRDLEGKPAIFSHFEKVDIKTLIASAPDKSAYPEDNAVILLTDSRNVVYDRGASETSEELLVKVFGNGGIEAFKERWITYNPYSQDLIVEKAVVIKSDGSEIKADVDISHIVFKSLEANDFIYLKWRIKNFYSGKLAKHFWDSFYFNGYYPIKEARYSLLVPKNFDFKHKVQHMVIKPQIKNTKDGKLYAWSLKDEPAVKYEYYMPGLEDVGKMLHISSIDDWGELVDWYSDLARTKTRRSFEVKELAQKLFDEKKSYSEAEKIETIYNFITRKINYSYIPFRQSRLVPQKARDVLVTKMGDCKDMATLCIAMLQEVGMEANYLLLNTKDLGRNEHVLPSLAFNHVIVAVETQNGRRYLDPTASTCPYGSLPAEDVGGFSLLIKQGNDSPEYLTPDNLFANNIFRITEAEVLDDHSLVVRSDVVRTGIQGAAMRYWYRDEGQQEREKSLAGSLSKDFANIKLTKFELPNLQDLTPEVSYKYHFEASNYVTETSGFLILSVPWSDALEKDQALHYENRQYPYNYWPSADTLIQEISIKLPAGLAPLELQEQVDFSCAIADYSLSYSFSGNVLKGRRMFVNKKQVVSTTEYKEFKEFHNNVLNADTRQILFGKTFAKKL